MGVSSSTTVASWILTEVMSQEALAPLRGKTGVLLQFLNFADISGRSSKVRKIRKKSAIAAAVDDTEALAFSTPATLGVAANISITPTTKVQGIQVTTDAIELALPGVSRAQVIAAIESGNPASLAFVRDVMMEIMEAHYLRAEEDSLALFSGLSESAGTTNTALSFATLLDALMKVLDNNPSWASSTTSPTTPCSRWVARAGPSVSTPTSTAARSSTTSTEVTREGPRGEAPPFIPDKGRSA